MVRATAPDVPPRALEFMFVFMFIPQALLPLVALLYASGIIQDEQEEQTFTYLLIRPIPNWAIYVRQTVGHADDHVVLTAVFTTLTYVVIYVGADTGWRRTSRCAVSRRSAFTRWPSSPIAVCSAS